MTRLWLVYVRSYNSRHVWSQYRGSGSSLEMTGLRRWCIWSSHYAASGHHFTVGAWQSTVEIKRLWLNGGNEWRASINQTLAGCVWSI